MPGSEARRLREAMEARKLSFEELAGETKISVSALKDLLGDHEDDPNWTQERKTSVRTVDAVRAELKVNLIESPSRRLRTRRISDEDELLLLEAYERLRKVSRVGAAATIHKLRLNALMAELAPASATLEALELPDPPGLPPFLKGLVEAHVDHAHDEDEIARAIKDLAGKDWPMVSKPVK